MECGVLGEFTHHVLRRVEPDKNREVEHVAILLRQMVEETVRAQRQK